MKKNKKYIITFFTLVLFFILLITILNFFAKENRKNQEENYIEEKTVQLIDDEKIEQKDEAIIVYIENTVQEQEIREEIKDASALTHEIYDMNCPIGILTIPKTDVNTEVFSNQTVDKMEEMPCFLYTTGGLNKIGTTLIVGHNRVNGTLFSDNGKLEAGDEFYFKDFEEKELRYTIISKEIRLDTDTSFLTESVDKPTMVLSCCSDNDDEYRIIIIGVAEEET